MAGFVDFFGKNKTFRPKKKFQQGTLRYSLHKRAQASLDSAVNLQEAVKLPPGENLNDWLAVHVVDFFNRINLIYGTVIDSCTEESCPTMSGGPRFEYLWADGVQYKRPTPLPAHKYISLLMDWIESNINNEEIFPVTVEVLHPLKVFIMMKRKRVSYTADFKLNAVEKANEVGNREAAKFFNVDESNIRFVEKEQD
ncbi:MOB kinase activator-like 3 [Trichonephila clavipes]|nr:MOB kinase activator-like 3 [Trichonephila clavipes]